MGALFFCVVAVGDRKIWVRDSFVLHNLNDDMGLLFALQLLETVEAYGQEHRHAGQQGHLASYSTTQDTKVLFS